jgi:DNA repair exonuclease SbcCD ATPase subunit
MNKLNDMPKESAPISIPEGSNFDVNALAGMFASKAAIADLEKRLEACETQGSNSVGRLNGHDDQIEKILSMFKNYENNLASLKSNLAALEQKVAGLNNAPLPAPTGEVDTALLMQHIQALSQKVEAVSSKVESKADTKLVTEVRNSFDNALADIKNRQNASDMSINKLEREIARINQFLEML